jgi:hypothetical protein
MASWSEQRQYERRRKEIREEHRRQYAQAVKEGRVKPEPWWVGWGQLLLWGIVFALILFLIGALNAGTNTMPITG